ncbi:hypothetical protein RNZ50_15830 [Paracoccaceae bacterium Fryx2]|nr:hypothetical protein [Paracoccaceae bacterium Fryx2]
MTTTIEAPAGAVAAPPPKSPLAIWRQLRLRIARIAAAEVMAADDEGAQLLALDLANAELDAAVEDLCALEAQGVLQVLEGFLVVCGRFGLKVGGGA